MKDTFIITVLAISLLLNGTLIALYLEAQSKARRKKGMQRGQKLGWGVIPVSPVYDLFATFERSELGPLASTAVGHIANDHTPGGISDYESWILCNLAKGAERIFEFGTATGKTAYLLACNSPDNAVVHTITLAPDERASYQHDNNDTKSDFNSAIEESDFDHFVYSETDAEQKIDQLFGDSKTYSFDRYQDQMDLIFVDGSHARSYVESDTKNALAMLRDGGRIVWHDYRGPEKTVGVYEALNELAGELQLTQIRGTCMVVYQKPILD